MTRFFQIFFPIVCVMALSGCVSREAADAKLAKGCEAGVNAILPEGVKIDRIISREYSPAVDGPGFRHVRLVAVEKGDWLEEEKKYECIFEESFALFNTGHTAAIYRIEAADKIIGKSGREILGDTEDFLKLTDAIRRAMYE